MNIAIKTIISISASALLASSLFATNTPTIPASSTHAQTVVALLSKISTQLETLQTGQVKTQHSLNNYSTFEWKTDYPSTPFPGWKNALSTNNDSNSLDYGSFNENNLTSSTVALFLTKTKSNPKRQTTIYHFAQDAIAPLQTEIQNVQTSKQKLNEYTTILDEHLSQMNATQIARLRTKIDLLNTKINALKYSQNIRTQKILIMIMLNSSHKTGEK